MSDQAEWRPVIEAKGLTKRFGAFTAADHISFTVMPGKIFGLLGPNGAGKSTTFRMLCGLSRPTEGQCAVAGIDLLRRPGQGRAQLGYMAQKFSLYGDLTVTQNIRLFAELYGMSRQAVAERESRLLAALDLTPFLHVQAQSLPLGQKQRLALLCATLHGPRALFLDEPTSGVDPRTRREFVHCGTPLPGPRGGPAHPPRILETHQRPDRHRRGGAGHHAFYGGGGILRRHSPYLSGSDDSLGHAGQSQTFRPHAGYTGPHVGGRLYRLYRKLQ